MKARILVSAIILALVAACASEEVGTNSVDCSSTQDCVKFGKCTNVGGLCAVGGTKDCKNSMLCLDFGECSAIGGACVATSDADCANSTHCGTSGRCKVEDGTCTWPYGSCQYSVPVKFGGTCDLTPQGGICTELNLGSSLQGAALAGQGLELYCKLSGSKMSADQRCPPSTCAAGTTCKSLLGRCMRHCGLPTKYTTIDFYYEGDIAAIKAECAADLGKWLD